MTLKQERKALERTLKSPKKKRGLEVRALRKELKNSPLRRYHDDTPDNGQGLGQADREED